jgi:PKD repeat protein
MKKNFTFLFVLMIVLIGANRYSYAQCNITGSITATPDTIGSYGYTITGTWQNASQFANSYITINPGQTFYNQNSFHYTFPFGGTFVICLTVNDSMNTPGTCSYTVCDTIVVGSSNSCGAFISAVNNGGANFTFTGTPNTPNGWNVAYSWSFGDGTSSTSNPASHTYTSNSTYTVCLSTTASDPANPSSTCSGTSCQTITVQGNPNGGGAMNCMSGFTSYNLGSGNFSFVNNSYSSDSSATTYYNWQIDGTNFSSLANPNYLLSDSLPHLVCLSVMFYNPSTGDSCYSSFCDSVQILGNNGGGGNPSTCQAGFVLWQDSVNTSLYYGYNTSTGSSSMSYLWDFGDGTSATGPYPTHTYANTGIYNVCLTVVDSMNNCTSTYCDSAGVFKLMNTGMSQIIILPNSSTGINNNETNIDAFVSPNPVNENSILNINSKNQKTISISIHDLTGREISIETMILQKGKNSFHLSRLELNHGIYFLSILENGKSLKTIRVIK